MKHAKHFIGGEWIEAASKKQAASVNPSDGTTNGSYSAGSATELNAAVHAARKAFEKGGWSNNPRRRQAVMLAMADRLEAGRAELRTLAVAECGKTTREINHEIDAAVGEMRYYAGLARSIFGRTQEVGEGQLSIFAREPIGIAGIIVPWNAPVTLLIRSLGPALAVGCTTVTKPAPQTSLTNALMMKMMGEAPDLPSGVLNSVNEDGIAVGRAMVAHPDVDVISFTGAASTGRSIMSDGAKTLKRLSLELGGKTPAIIFADADLEAATTTIVRCALAAAGQMCTAVARVIVQDTVYENVAVLLSKKLAAINVRRADDPTADMGPVIDADAHKRLTDLVAKAKGRCEVLLEGGVPETTPSDGNFLSPSLIAVQELQSRYIQDELFGPILVVERFSDEAEASHRANATVYGLAASVWTANQPRSQRMARAIKSGTVWINSHNRLFAEAETGGFKQSGLGRLHGLEGLDDFLETKHIFSEAGFTPSVQG